MSDLIYRLVGSPSLRLGQPGVEFGFAMNIAPWAWALIALGCAIFGVLAYRRTEGSFAGRVTLGALRSLLLLYRKGSSYYALCLLGRLPGCTFYLSCQFQDDGTTNFEKVPDIEGVNFSEGCPLTSLPRPARRIPARFQESVPYLVNGSRSHGGASSVIIRNGQPKLELRK